MKSQTARILLIEEDETLADITAFRLELSGYVVDVVHSAHDAFPSLENRTPNIIITDIVLPDIDGCEFISRLSHDPKCENVPIMVFSTNAALDQVEKAYAAGAKQYLVTPYDPTVLDERVESLL
ncbi:MAG: response regulator [Pirellulales bacterium]|nr:response regulator [Pirellulales bacterium]